MHSWEYVVIAAGAAFVALVIYLIVTLSKLKKTIADIDELVAKNSADISALIANAGDITSKANGLVTVVSDKVSGVAGNLKQQTGFNAGTVSSLITAAGVVISAAKLVNGYAKQRKVNKLIKNANKNKSAKI